MDYGPFLIKLADAAPLMDFKRQSLEIQEAALQAIRSIFPIKGVTRTLTLDKLWVEDKLIDDDFTGQKRVRLTQGTWEVPTYGTLTLTQNATGKIVSQVPKMKLLGIPKWTPRYGFIVGGNEYQVTHQLRLKSGAYSTITKDQLYETQINTEKGHNFRLILDPKNQIFSLVPSTSSAHIKLYSVLNYMGMPDSDMRAVWGDDVFETNRKNAQGTLPTEIHKLHKAMFSTTAPDKERAVANIKTYFQEKTKISPETTKAFLGRAHETINPQLFLDSSKRLLLISRGKELPDDRNSVANKELHSVESFIKQGIQDRALKIQTRLAYNIEKRDDIRTMISPSQFSEPVNAFFSRSSLATTPKQINPLHMLNEQLKVTVMGEGGIKSERSVPDALRQVHGSHLGVFDPLTTPEGGGVGTSMGLAMGVSKRGTDLVQSLVNLKTGHIDQLTTVEVQSKHVAFPGEFVQKNGRWAPKTAMVRVMHRASEHLAPASQATHMVMNAKSMFGFAANLVPFMNANSGGRALFSVKHQEQAMSLLHREAPLVQSLVAPGLSFDKALGKEASTVCRVDGIVVDVTKEAITVRDAAGALVRHGLYDNFPLNQKSMLHSYPLVQKGAKVRAGQVIADSNFSKDGHLALGTNMTVAYLPYHGFSFEDGTCISESAAKKLTSLHMYRYQVDLTEGTLMSQRAFAVRYPSLYRTGQLAKLDDTGVVKVGQKVAKGDPLAVRLVKEAISPEDRILAKLKRGAIENYKNRSVTWEEQVEGEITDVIRMAKQIVIVVKTEEPAVLADKLCYDDQTEVLTGEGWKFFRDLSLDDEIATLSSDHRLVYQRPDRLDAYEHRGDMYHAQAQQVDLCVTMNHRMYVRRRGRHSFELIEAQQLLGVRQVQYKKDALWEAADVPCFSLGSVTVPAGQGGVTARELPGSALPMDLWLEFLGYYVADGCAGAYAGGYTVEIIKSPKRYPALRDRICSLVKELGFHPMPLSDRIRINSVHLVRYLQALGKRRGKCIPSFVRDLSARQIRIFLEAYGACDGARTAGGAWHLTPDNSEMAGLLQELCLKAGWAGNIKIRPASPHPGMPGAINDTIQVRVNRTKLTPEFNHSHARTQKAQVEEVIQYAGQVYCCEVPNHVVYVRRGGKPVWCGNSNRHGAKGVITRIIPDHEMPRIASTGQLVDVLLNPNGVAGRMNIGQLLENVAGKVAKARKDTFFVDNFAHGDLAHMVSSTAARHGIKDKEDILDPKTGKIIKSVAVGTNYILKLDHPVKSKFSARSMGPYQDDLTPTRGDHSGGQSVDALTFYGLIAHGAKHNMKEMATLKSQDNPEFWRAFQTGQPLPKPRPTMVFNKFLDMLKGAGVNVEKNGSSMSLLPMTDRHVMQLSAGAIKLPTVVLGKNLEPEKGGLFDPHTTGGLQGCFHYTTRVLTDRGNLRIGDIVTKGLDARALSYNKETGALEYRAITTRWTNEESPGLISLNYGSSGAVSGYIRRFSPEVLWCTPEHEIYDRGLEKVAAQTLEGQTIHMASHALSATQCQILLGSLLGDGWIDDRRSAEGDRSALFSVRHCEAQKDYLEAKAQVLRFWLSPRGVHRLKDVQDGINRQPRWSFSTFQHQVFVELRDLFYEPTGRKRVTRGILDQVSEVALAVWCMDDGSGWFQEGGNKHGFRLATHCFNEAEVDLIMSWFQERWGLSCTKQRDGGKYGGRDLGWGLYFSANNMDRLVELVRPYIHPSMAYKFFRAPRVRPCRLCGLGLDPRFDFCDSCLLSSLRATGFPGWRAYDRHPAKVGDSSNIRQRFGTWSAAIAAAQVPCPVVVPEPPPVFGEGLPALLQEGEPPRVLRQTVVRSIDSSGRRRYSVGGTSYDLEIEGNHNYFANGVLVGNSNWTHIDLAEPMPHPTFEDPIKTLTGLKQASFDSLVAGKTYVDPKTHQLTDRNTGLTAGPAIKHLLSRVNVDKRIAALKLELPGLSNAALNQGHKEIRYLMGLKETGTKPEEYVISKLPALPPIFRPSYPDQNGNLRHSTLNYLYRDALLANNDMKDLVKLPDSEKSDLRSALYQGVSALAGLGAQPLSSQGQDKWQGIIQQIAGEPQPKHGLFQSKLLKRRQDLSGRSTAVGDPNMQLDDIGLPEEMAWQTFRPHIIRELTARGKTILQAQADVDAHTPEARAAMSVVASRTPVLMNRAPSLHKFSIMAFMPKLVTGQAIRTHPLITKGMNLDYDGDTLAIHTPVTPAAIKEAYKMLPSQNLFSGATGQLMTVPDGEAILGLYFLTLPGKITGKTFLSEDAVVKLMEAGKLHPEDVVTVAGKQVTAGKITVMREMPVDMRDYTKVWTKKVAGEILSDLARKDPVAFPKIVNKLKDLGNRYAYFRGVTMGISDMMVSRTARDKLFAAADKKVHEIVGNKHTTAAHKNAAVLSIYQDVDKDMKGVQTKTLAQAQNHLYHTVQAGVRGSAAQVKQIAFAPVLYNSAQSTPVPMAVKHSYSEGLDPAEYWISLYGARKGVIDRSKETSRPGALQKAMLRTATHYVITKLDCGTYHGVEYGAMSNSTTALGHCLAADTGNFKRNATITTSMLSQLKTMGPFLVRSPMTCEATQGVCQLCYGQALDRNALPPIGENVGAIAAHSIGEPSTQLIMRTFHTGGLSSAVGGITSSFDRMNELMEVPKNLPAAATLSKIVGSVTRVEPTGTGGYRVWVEKLQHTVPPGRTLLVKVGDRAAKGQKLSAGTENPHDILALKGVHDTRNYISSELHNTFNDSGIPVRKVHTDIIARALTEHTIVKDPGGHPDFVVGDIAPAARIDAWNKQNPGKAVKHAPMLTGMSFLPLRTQDWLDRMASRNLKDTLLSGAAQHWRTDTTGVKPIPAWVFGSTLGENESGLY